MKVLMCVRKYVFVMAGLGAIMPDGYRTPFNVYRRVFPFIYKYLGTCWLARWDKPEDIVEWIKDKEADK